MASETVSGNLTIVACSAHDLEPKDTNGFSDPYCIVKVGKQLHKTKVIKKSLDPVWNESFVIRLDSTCLDETIVEVQVWDKDLFGKDFEGEVDISLSSLNLLAEGKHEADFALNPRAGKKDVVKGHVRLKFALDLDEECKRKLQAGAEAPAVKKPKLEDFTSVRVLGQGHYGKVVQVTHNESGETYAMKVIKKSKLTGRDLAHTVAEKDITAHSNHPFMVHLHYSFQSEDKLYLVMDFVQGGEMFYHFQFTDHFSEDRTRFYAAELVSVLSYLHSLDIVYRDLKPENILLDFEGHIRLADFGLCKMEMKEGERTKTFCGTPEYLSPEQLRGKGYGKEVDWWALGCVLYEMVLGLPPFFVEDNTQAMYQKIMTEPVVFPSDYPVSAEFKSFISQLLEKDPTKRLGSGSDGAANIEGHEFFRSIDWGMVFRKEIAPPYKPPVKSKDDALVSNDVAHLDPNAQSVAEKSKISSAVQDAFKGFTFEADSVLEAAE